MGTDSERALLWLPGSFLIEVLAWEIGSRMGWGIVDSTWEELGRSIHIERITWGLGGAVVVLFAVFMLLFKGHHKTEVSCVQLVGILGLVAYWIGASVLASGTVVVLATVAAVILSGRREA